MPLIEEIADVSDAASGAPPDPDENYAAFTERRLEKEWEEQLEIARAANVGVDEHDVDVRDLYGEQSVHNYPDVHADWGDARHARAAAAFPNAEASGWNTEYRAQLEHAMGVVRDSKEVMKNLKTIRRRKKDIDEGVEVGHLRGVSAEEANREWEASRADRRERDRRRREAKAAAAAAAEAEAEAEAAAAAAERDGTIAGLKKLPDFITRGRGVATSPLAEAHDQWLEALGDAPRRNAVDAEPDAEASRRDEPRESAPEATATTANDSATTAKDAHADSGDSSSEDEDAETSFLKHLSSLSPLKRAAASKTEEADFWNREVYGAEDPSVEEDMDAFEAEMARLCATEISAARNATTED